MAVDRSSRTSAQLRDAIDREMASDKVAFPDPAAAPLGTDDEAAGHPPTNVELEWAYRVEIESRPNPDSAPTDRRPVDSVLSSRNRSGGGMALAVFVAVLAAGLVALVVTLA